MPKTNPRANTFRFGRTPFGLRAPLPLPLPRPRPRNTTRRNDSFATIAAKGWEPTSCQPNLDTSAGVLATSSLTTTCTDRASATSRALATRYLHVIFRRTVQFCFRITRIKARGGVEHGRILPRTREISSVSTHTTPQCEGFCSSSSRQTPCPTFVYR